MAGAGAAHSHAGGCCLVPPSPGPARPTRLSAPQIHFDVANRSTGKVMDSSLIFDIRVRDVNDHAPRFPAAEFNAGVRENHAAGGRGGPQTALPLCCLQVPRPWPGGAPGPSWPQGHGGCLRPEGPRPWVRAKCSRSPSELAVR